MKSPAYSAGNSTDGSPNSAPRLQPRLPIISSLTAYNTSQAPSPFSRTSTTTYATFQPPQEPDALVALDLEKQDELGHGDNPARLDLQNTPGPVSTNVGTLEPTATFTIARTSNSQELTQKQWILIIGFMIGSSTLAGLIGFFAFRASS